MICFTYCHLNTHGTPADNLRLGLQAAQEGSYGGIEEHLQLSHLPRPQAPRQRHACRLRLQGSQPEVQA